MFRIIRRPKDFPLLLSECLVNEQVSVPTLHSKVVYQHFMELPDEHTI